MNTVLFETSDKQKCIAGSKARQDALKIALACGYRHIPLFYNGRPHPIVAMEMIRGCASAILHTGSRDRLLVQYPYAPMLLNRIFFAVLRAGQRLKKYTITVLIHDLTSLRNVPCADQRHNTKLQDELHMMRGCELIYHNTSMRDACENVCPAAAYRILGVFDYLYDGPVCPRVYSAEPVVMVAGNLHRLKCGYVYQLPALHDVRFDLFGINYSEMQADNIRYRGSFSPEELIPHLDGQFGLVWDGDSLDTCSGGFGEYLKYNNPHKFSLYLAAGMPVIVWSRSALADFVREKGIGLCVDSIRDLPPMLESLTEEKYRKMVKCTMRLCSGIISGENLKRILSK